MKNPGATPSRRPLFLILGVLLFSLLFAVPAFFLQPFQEAYAFSAYQLERDSAPGTTGPVNWKIDVRGVERADRKVKIPAGIKLADVMTEFESVHKEAGEMVSHWLSTRTPEEISGKLTQVSGREVAPHLFQNTVEVEFLAAGWQKRVYLLRFPLKEGAPAVVLLKIPKGEAASFEHELRHQTLLTEKGHTMVPRLAEVVSGNGKLFYFEEFIAGEKLTALRSENKVSPEIRQAILHSLLVIYRETGSIPAGIRPKQIFVRDTQDGKQEIVFIDLGGQALSAPLDVLDQLDMWYGKEGRGLNSLPSMFNGISQWKFLQSRRRGKGPAVRDAVLFREFEEVFGAEKGKALLQEAQAAIPSRRVSAFRFTHDDFEPFFRGETRIARYTNLFVRRVRERLSQLDRRVEYQHLKLDLKGYLADLN